MWAPAPTSKPVVLPQQPSVLAALCSSARRAVGEPRLNRMNRNRPGMGIALPAYEICITRAGVTGSWLLWQFRA